MNDGLLCITSHLPRCWRAGAGGVLAILLTGAAAWGQAGAAPAAAKGVPGAAVAAKPPPQPKSPRQLAEEIVPLLRQQKTPWQIYASYVQMFQGFAEREKATRPATDRAAAVQAKMVEHLTGMADLLSRMGDLAKLRQSIQKGTSGLAPEKRQETFVQAKADHDRLLAEFVRMASVLAPGQKVAPAAP